MALNPSNGSNLERLALKGLRYTLQSQLQRLMTQVCGRNGIFVCPMQCMALDRYKIT